VFGPIRRRSSRPAWRLARSGKLWDGFASKPTAVAVGYALAIVVGVPARSRDWALRTLEAAIGIDITAGYDASGGLVPLLVLWSASASPSSRDHLSAVGGSDLHQHLARRECQCRRP